MRLRKPRIRVTEIAMGLRCPLQFYLLKTVGPKPPSGAATTGTSFHKAMEVNFTEKAKIGIDAPEDVCTDAYNERFKELLLDTDWSDMDSNEMLNTGIGMVKSARKELTPSVEVASEEDVERPFIIDCGDFEVTGTVDLVLPDGTGTIDWKTSSKMWYQDRANKEIQGFLYPFGVTPMEDEMLLPLAFKIISYAGKTGSFPVQHSRISAEYLMRSARRLLRTVEMMEEPNPGPFQNYCSDKYCGWRDKFCPLFAGGGLQNG